jgi:hypothetical protein
MNSGATEKHEIAVISISYVDDEPVQGEPVSGRNSLFCGNLQGIVGSLGAYRPKKR